MAKAEAESHRHGAMLSRAARRGLWTALAVLLLLLAALLVEFAAFRGGQDADARAHAAQVTQEMADALGELVDRVEADGAELARTLSQALEGGDLDADALEALLRRKSLDFPEIRGVTACFEPFAFDEAERLYCPYYNKATSAFQDVGASYDYTQAGEGTRWYTDVRDGGARWAKPYFGSGAGEWFIGYGMPIRRTDGTVIGVVDYSLEVNDFQRIVHGLSVGRASRTYVRDGYGVFLAHPASDRVGRESAAGTGDRLDRAVMDALSDGAEALLPTGSPRGYLAVRPVAGANMQVAAIFLARDLPADHRARSRRWINIAVLFSALLILSAVIWFSRDELSAREIEGLSLATTAALLLNVVFIGWLVQTLPVTHEADESLPITDVAGRQAFVAAEAMRASELKLAEPVAVPTGLYIERMEFADSYNVNIGGIVWQRYPLDRLDEIETGIRLPQISPFAEAALIEESYRREVRTKEGETPYMLIGYDVRVTLRLDFSYADFPFDRRHLDIAIVPASRNSNVILVPDLDGYESTNPAQRAGIDPDIRLPGTRIVESYFNFTASDLDTNFGLGAGGMNTHIPVLHFNIIQKRNLLNAFVTYLIPIVVTLALIYILILACEKTEARQGIIESMAAFFFVLIFSHIDLRKTIQTGELMFMEYFYFITYAMIVLATANLIAYTRSRTSLFDYNHNQVFRAVYFPVFLGLVLVVMIARFY